MVDQLGKQLTQSATLNMADMIVNQPPVFKQVGGGKKSTRPDADQVSAGMDEVWAEGGGEEGWAEEEELVEQEVVDESVQKLEVPIENFEEACELANSVMGYPIDDFQQRCLKVVRG